MSSKAQEQLPDWRTLWDFYDPAATEVKFKELLPLAEEQGDSVYLGELYTQIGRTYSLRKMFDEAHEILDTIEQWELAKYPVVHVRYWLERGRTFNSAGIKDKALNCFNKAWYLGVSNGLDPLAIDAAHMLGIAESEPGKQLQWSENALKIAESSDDPKAKGWLAPLYNNIGWTYFDMGQYQTSFDHLKKGLDWRLANSKDERGIFIAKWSVAKLYRFLDKPDEAMKILLALEKEMEATDYENGYVYEELGENYLNAGNESLTKVYFGKAYDILKKDDWLKDNEAERLKRLKELSH